MISLATGLKLAAVAAIALGAAGWHLHRVAQARDAEHALVMNEWQADTLRRAGVAARRAAELRAREERREAELLALRAQLESKDALHRDKVAALSEDLRRNSRAAGGSGLRDPWATDGGCRGGAGEIAPNAVSGGADAPQAAGVLSAEFEGLLLGLASEADALNRAYTACREDAVNVRRLLGSP